MKKIIAIIIGIALLAGCGTSNDRLDYIYTDGIDATTGTFGSLTSDSITAEEATIDAVYLGATYVWDGSAYQLVTYTTGNVIATANLGDNTVIRGDGGGFGVQGSLATINDFGTINAPAYTGENLQMTGKLEGDRLYADVEGYSIDVVQASDANIALNDTLVIDFLFEPDIITLNYSGRARHNTASEVGHTTGHSVITITGVNTITYNTNYTAFVDVNGAMGGVAGQNDAASTIVVYGGNDGVTDAVFRGVGTWVTATHTLTLTFSTVTDTIDAFNFVEIVATAYR